MRARWRSLMHVTVFFVLFSYSSAVIARAMVAVAMAMAMQQYIQYITHD